MWFKFGSVLRLCSRFSYSNFLTSQNVSKGQNRACTSRQDGIWSKVGHIHKKKNFGVILSTCSKKKNWVWVHTFAKTLSTVKWNFAKSAQWSFFFGMIVKKQWTNDVRSVTNNYESVMLALCECSGLCYNKKYVRIYFGRKLHFLSWSAKIWSILPIFSICEKAKKSVLEKSEHTFFHQLLNIMCGQSICQNQIDRINFFVTHIRTSIHSYLHRTKKLQYNFISKLKS